MPRVSNSRSTNAFAALMVDSPPSSPSPSPTPSTPPSTPSTPVAPVARRAKYRKLDLGSAAPTLKARVVDTTVKPVFRDQKANVSAMRARLAKLRKSRPAAAPVVAPATPEVAFDTAKDFPVKFGNAHAEPASTGTVWARGSDVVRAAKDLVVEPRPKRLRVTMQAPVEVAIKTEADDEDEPWEFTVAGSSAIYAHVMAAEENSAMFPDAAEDGPAAPDYWGGDW